MRRIRYDGIDRVQDLREIPSIGQVVLRHPKPIALTLYLLDCCDLLVQFMCRETPVPEALCSACIRMFRHATMTTLHHILFKIADLERSRWTYGTTLWYVMALLINLRRQPVACPEFLRKDICCTTTALQDMSLREVVDALDALAIQWSTLAPDNVEDLRTCVHALEYRAAELVCQESMHMRDVKYVANFFLLFHQSLHADTLWDHFQVTPPNANTRVFQNLCHVYIDNKGFKKKMLTLFFILAKRISDVVRAKESYTAQSLLQDGRSETWYQSMQHVAYKGSLQDLFDHETFQVAMTLNAVDLWFKNKFSVNFIEHFVVLQDDMFQRTGAMKACDCPLIICGDMGVRLFFRQRQTCPMDISRVLAGWFYLVMRDHQGIIFKNIQIHPPRIQ